jgi:hypothetical protein
MHSSSHPSPLSCNPWLLTYLTHGAIFKASLRLMQKPAPPVANQNCTSLWEEESQGSV